MDGELVQARVVLVSCNAYKLDLFSIGERDSLDEGRLHLYVPHGLGASRGTSGSPRASRSTPPAKLRAAVDGEPARLETPLELRSSGALRCSYPAR